LKFGDFLKNGTKPEKIKKTLKYSGKRRDFSLLQAA
jgi:hypothetical protein